MVKAGKYLFFVAVILLASCADGPKALPADDHSAPINGKHTKARRPPPSNYHSRGSVLSPF